MKKFLQKSCHWLVMLIAWFAVSVSAMAQEWTTVYENSVSSAEFFNTLYVYDANGADGEQGTWRFYESQARYMYNSTKAGDDYLVLPKQTLEVGKKYRISFDENTPMASQWGNESFEVVYGSASGNNPYADIYSNVILANATYTMTSYSTIRQEFTVSESGEYFIAIHATTPNDHGYIYVKNIKLESYGNGGTGEGGGTTDPEETSDGTAVTTLLDGMQYTLAAVSYRDHYKRFWNVNSDESDIILSDGEEGTLYTCEVHGDKVALRTPGGKYLRIKQNGSVSWLTDFSLTGLSDTYDSYFCDLTIEAFSGYENGIAIKGARGIQNGAPYIGYFCVAYSNYGASEWSFSGNSSASWASNYTTIFEARQYSPIASEEIEYTLEFEDAPEGAYVTIDGTQYDANATWSVAKNLNAGSVHAYEPEGYYAEVGYEEVDHKFTVTYKHWLTYNVSVTGHPMGALAYDNEYYGNGDSFQSKTVIDQSVFSAYALNGYDEAISVSQESQYVYNVAVTYTESAPITYNVVFNTVPEGAYAWINGVKYEANGSFQTNLELSPSNLQEVYCPEGYYDNSYYSADDHTFYINYIEYVKYTVKVEGTDNANAGVRFEYNDYHDGDIIYVNYTLNENSVVAINVAGYKAEVTLEDHLFTVTYTEKPIPTAPWTINFDEEGRALCQIVDNNGANTWTAGNNNFYYPYDSSTPADDYIILPAVKLEAGKSYNVSVECQANSTSWKESMEVVYGTVADIEEFDMTAIANTVIDWTYRKAISDKITIEADGNYYFALHATSPADRDHLYAYNFSIKEIPALAPNRISINWSNDACTDGGNVEKITGIQVYFDEYLTGVNGVPAGMTFKKGDVEVPITYIYNGGNYYYFGFNEDQTDFATYTLHVPAEAFEFTNGSKSAAIDFTFVIPTPEFFAAPSVTPVAGTYESLNSFTINAPAGVTFDASVGVKGNIKKDGSTLYTYDELFSEDGSSVTVTFGEITTDGDYTFVFPAGYLRSTTGEWSPEVTVEYTIAYPWYYFSHVTPSSNSEVSELDVITITAPNGVTFDCTSEGESRQVVVKVNDVDANVAAKVYADRVELAYKTDVIGQYNFVVPASTFAANEGAKANKEFSFSYKIIPTLAVNELAVDAEGNYWTTFAFDQNYTLPAGYTPYKVVGTSETGTLSLEEIVGSPKTLEVKAYFYNYNNVEGASATIDENYNVVCENLSNNGISVSGSGPIYEDSNYFDVYDGATLDIVSTDGAEIVSVDVRSWDPISYRSENWNVQPIANGFRVTWSGFSYLGGIVVNLATDEFNAPILPAGAGILVKASEASAGVAYTKTYNSATANMTGNLLVGCTESALWNEDGKTYYKFSLDADDAAGSAGFYWGVEGGASIQAHAGKAYLVLDTPAASNSRYLISGNGLTTGINAIATEATENIFNLQGQRVVAPKAGVYVKNGKKIIVK